MSACTYISVIGSNNVSWGTFIFIDTHADTHNGFSKEEYIRMSDCCTILDNVPYIYESS